MRAGELAHLGAATDALAASEDEAVDREEHRGGKRLGEDGPERVLEEQPDYTRRDGRDDEQPGEALVGCLDASSPQ